MVNPAVIRRSAGRIVEVGKTSRHKGSERERVRDFNTSDINKLTMLTGFVGDECIRTILMHTPHTLERKIRWKASFCCRST